jgi:hypothetical protein
MLSGFGRSFFSQAPWIAIYPGLAISLAVSGFNMLDDTLRDVWIRGFGAAEVGCGSAGDQRWGPQRDSGTPRGRRGCRDQPAATSRMRIGTFSTCSLPSS